jgi:sigma-54 interacting transcriptional regulator
MLDSARSFAVDSPPPALSLWPPEAWTTLVHTHVNLLVTGAMPVCAAFVNAMKPHVAPPVYSASCGLPFTIPPGVRTLILRSPEVLDSDEQRRFLEWLDRTDRQPQVIAVTSAPLYARVEQREFIDELYYRLNVVRVDVAPARAGASLS